MWIRKAMICPVVLVILSTLSTKYVKGFLSDPEEFLRLDMALRLLSGKPLVDPFQELFPHPFFSDPVSSSRDFREPEPTTPAPPTTTISPPLPIYSYRRYSAEPNYSTPKARQVQIGFPSGNSQNNDRGNQQFNSQSNEQFNRQSSQRFSDPSNQRFKDEQNQQFNSQPNQQFNSQPNQQFNSQNNQQFSSQPNQQFKSQPNQQFNSQPNQQFNSQPNQQFSSQPNQQFNSQSNQLNQQFNSQPNQQFSSQPNQQFNSQPNQQFNSQLNQQFNSQPNQQFNSQSNQQFNSQPNQQFSSQPNQQFNSQSNQLNQQFNSQPNQQFNSQPNQQFNSQPNQQFNSQPNQQFNSQPNQQFNSQSNQQFNSQSNQLNQQFNSQSNQLNRQPNTQMNQFNEQPSSPNFTPTNNPSSPQLSDTQSSIDQLGLAKTLKFLKNYRTQNPNSGEGVARQPKSEFQAFGAVPYQKPQEAQPVLYSNHYYQKQQYQTAPDATISYRPYDQSAMYRQPDLSNQYYSNPYTYSGSQSHVYHAPTMSPESYQNNVMYRQYDRPYQPTKQTSYQTDRLVPDTGMMIRAGEGIPIPSIQPQFNYSNTPTTPDQYLQLPPQVDTRSYYPTSPADNVPVLQQIPSYQIAPQTYTQQGYSAPLNQRAVYVPVNQPQPTNYYQTMPRQNLIQQPYLQPTPSPPKPTTVPPANQQEIEIESPENPSTTPAPVTTPLPLFIQNVLPALPTEINALKRFQNQPNQAQPRSPTRDQLLYLSPEFHHSLHLRGF